METQALLPLFGSPWADAETRPAAIARALEAWARGDFAPLLEGYQVFLHLTHRQRTAALRAAQARDFLSYLHFLGRKPLAWERGDYLRYREHLVARNLAPSTLVSHRYGAKVFLEFLAWAGQNPPPLDLPARERAYRQRRGLPRAAFEEVLEALETFPSKWREPLMAVLVLTGDLGLKLKDALRLEMEAVDAVGGKVRLKGGTAPLSKKGAALLRRYLDWRAAVRRYPTPLVVLGPEGAPPDPFRLKEALRYFSLHAPHPVNAHTLRYTGEARLISLYGTKGAGKLLGRVLVAS